MKKFSFGLQSILEYRKFLEDEAKMELAKAIACERAIESQIEKIANQYVKTKRTSEGERNFISITAANQYFVLLDRKKEDLSQELAQAQIVTEQKRNAFREAMQQTQSLEKLRDSKMEEWKQAVALEEEFLVDEVNIGRRSRR